MISLKFPRLKKPDCSMRAYKGQLGIEKKSHLTGLTKGWVWYSQSKNIFWNHQWLEPLHRLYEHWIPHVWNRHIHWVLRFFSFIPQETLNSHTPTHIALSLTSWATAGDTHWIIHLLWSRAHNSFCCRGNCANNVYLHVSMVIISTFCIVYCRVLIWMEFQQVQAMASIRYAVLLLGRLAVLWTCLQSFLYRSLASLTTSFVVLFGHLTEPMKANEQTIYCKLLINGFDS